MRINRLDTHDRLQHFINQDFDIAKCAQDMIDQRPFGAHPFYIFCHARTDDDGVSKRYIWSPWIWKPRAQTNSLLLKAYPGTDIVKWIWILPVREMWDCYKDGQMFADTFIKECTDLFDSDRALLEKPEDDDPSPERAQEIAFDYQPQLFKRDSLPEHLKGIWDQKMNELNRLKRANEVDSSSSV